MISADVIDEVLESLLLVSGDGLRITDIAEQMNTDKGDIDRAIARLKEKYSGKCGINLIVYNGKVQFRSNPAYGDVISCVLNPIKEKELSRAALETIAIIAYRQPVTRVEIEQIRGNGSDYTIQMLMSHNLIQVVGRKDSVGKPLLFGTTDEFLKRFQIESLDQLPDYETLLQTIKVIETPTETAPAEGGALYDNYEVNVDDEAASTVSDESEELPAFLRNENVTKVESK